ncbi:MAG: hypothetical protein RDU20_07165 [Desulfomonilaceae bacterium]|nr:hypothetical protein [Desulfomonilaceae bacterium]
MPQPPSILALVMLMAMILPAGALAEGEAILALTGQYTFFIKPEPGSCETYVQKMVPCVLEKEIPVPRRVVPVYPVPFSSKRGLPVLRSEIPVGCPDGAGPCVHCYPKPSFRSATHDVVVPVVRGVPVPDLVIQPKVVRERVMRPQWFKVREDPRPPRKVVRKVH